MESLLLGVSLTRPAPSSAKLWAAELLGFFRCRLVAACEGAMTVVETSDYDPIVKLCNLFFPGL